tara:strand:+ start:860 stop:1096 length:237 start_codon:yes stop_codon:yes gene_type:complete
LKTTSSRVKAGILVLLFPSAAFAYLGPGMAGGVIAAIVGFFVAIFVMLWAVLYYPIKRWVSEKNSSKPESASSSDPKD